MDQVNTDLLVRNPWVSRRPISRAEYHRMGEVGILEEGDRVELIEGQLVAMAPIGIEHSGTTITLNRLLVMAVGNRGFVGVGTPVTLGDYSEPQPDFSILRPRDDEY